MNFSIDFWRGPPIGQHKKLQKLYSDFTSSQCCDNFSTHFFMIFEEIVCLEVVAVFTIRNTELTCSYNK